uniref:Transmembrane protein n=1 Tax=Heterorhabditis bacteriophora TaxID=37862 RepID=A0A1I7WJL0_HETBA
MGSRTYISECPDGRCTPSQKIYSPVEQYNQRNYYDKYTNSSDSSPISSKDGGCLPWMKYGIFAANIVVGALILTMGVWLRTDSRFRDFLSER